VAAELGARYVLEGTVQREGDSVRINAQLTDAEGGHELWAERYDGKLSNVFALQDMVIGQIVAALAVKLTSAEQANAGTVETGNPDAYDAMLQGWEHYRRDTQEETIKAIALFDQAIALDPDYIRAHAALAAAHWRIAKSYWSAGAGGFMHAMDRTNQHLAKAMTRPNARALAVSAEVLSRQGRYDEAFAEIARAIAESPNDPEIYLSQAQILNATGRAPEAEEAVRRAMRLDPRYSPDYLRALAVSLFHQERYEETVETLARLLDLQPDNGDDYATLVASLGHLGRTDGVAEAIARFDEITIAAGFSPMTVQEQGGWWWYGDVFDYDQAYLGRLRDGLRKAGVPEGAGTDVAPADYRRIMRKSEGEYIIDGTTRIDVATARALRERGVTFIDVRAPLDFARGHVPGAINICVMTDLTRETLSEVVGKDEEVAFSCHGKYCGDSAYASAKAVLWGFTRVYYFAGGFPAWEDAGYPVEVSPQN
jgi:tetratricopeptide (TPR) repeat protein/rhodanese-related sulfurtransferase